MFLSSRRRPRITLHSAPEIQKKTTPHPNAVYFPNFPFSIPPTHTHISDRIDIKRNRFFHSNHFLNGSNVLLTRHLHCTNIQLLGISFVSFCFCFCFCFCFFSLSLIPNTSYTIIIIFFPLSVSVLSYLCCIPYKVRSRFAVSSISIYNLIFFFFLPPLSPFPHLPRSRAKDLRANSSPFKLPLTKKKKKDNSSTSCNQSRLSQLYLSH